MSEIRDALARLEAKATCEDCGGTGWITVRTGVYDADQEPCDCTEAIITAGAALKKVREDHLRPLVVALEGSDCWRSLADIGNSERICDPTVPNRPICGRCAELISVKCDIAKVEEMLA